MYQQLICSAIEKIINQALAYNLQGAQVVNVLEGQSLTIALEELNFDLHFIVDDRYVSVISGDKAQAIENTCLINTSISTLNELKENQQLTELIKQDRLAIEGDIKIAQQFMQIAESIKIDWRSELAKHIGDIPTFKLEQLTHFFIDKVNFATKQIQADASEWLVHEKRLVVTNSQLALFNQAVDDISTESIELTARVNALLSSNHPQLKDNCE